MLLRSQLRLTCGITVPNRLVFGPHRTNLGPDQGRGFSAAHVAYYRRRAEGGAGIVVTETASVHPDDWPYARAPLASACPQGWSTIAEACHTTGTLAIASLGHTGAQGSSAYSQAALWAPSSVGDVVTREVPMAMSPAEIAALVTGFGDAARRVARTGMDGIEINAGQDSLLRQFLSPLTNHRTDDYGTADRSRLMREVLRATRTALGPGRVLGLRLSCAELAGTAGITPKLAAELATQLHAALSAAGGLDYLVVTRGSGHSLSAVETTRPDSHTPVDTVTTTARPVRAALDSNVAICAQGAIVDPDRAEALLLEGTAQLVEMTRAQIADAELGLELGLRTTGNDSSRRAPRPCVLCNQNCRVDYPAAPAVSCVADPSSGHETGEPSDLEPASGHGESTDHSTVEAGQRAGKPAGSSTLNGEPAKESTTDDANGPAADSPPTLPAHPLEVLVIGAGPAGLETARAAASAGHAVRVVERANQTGGMLRIAALGQGRNRLSLLADWLHAECQRLGVTITTNHTAAESDIDAQLATGGAVVLCTGARPGRIGYRVGAGVRHMDDAGLLARLAVDAEVPTGPVIVYDRVGGPVALSIVETLAARNVDVTLVTPDHVPAKQLARTGGLSPAALRLAEAGITTRRRERVVGVSNGHVQVEGIYTSQTDELPAEILVDCGFRLPADNLWQSMRLGLDRAGDVIAPRGIQEAILDGRRAAQRLQEVRLW